MHAVNNTARPKGLTPTFLVFGAVPRIPFPDSSSLLFEQTSRLESTRTAKKEMETITAQRRIANALKHRHVLKSLLQFQFGDKLHISREDQNRFVGLYTVYGYDNEKTVYRKTDHVRPFSTSVVQLISQEELYPNGEPEKRNPKIGDKFEMFWPLDQKFYRGKVTSFDEKSNNYTIDYDDGDREKLKI